MTLQIQLSPETEQRLDRLAMRTGRPKTQYIEAFIRAGLDDLEDYQSASAVMERVRRGEERVYDLEEVERELGLAD